MDNLNFDSLIKKKVAQQGNFMSLPEKSSNDSNEKIKEGISLILEYLSHLDETIDKRLSEIESKLEALKEKECSPEKTSDQAQN